MFITWGLVWGLCLLSAACAHYRDLGTYPPSNPDDQPPMEARVTGKAMPGQPERQLEGRVLVWDEEGILFEPETCLDEKCRIRIPLNQVGRVEAKEKFGQGSTAKIIVASTAVVVIVGFFGYFIYKCNENPFCMLW